MSKIAVIGSGISGLTCAYLLGQQHEVSLFEAADYLGGHTATVDVELVGGGGTIGVSPNALVRKDAIWSRFTRSCGQNLVLPSAGLQPRVISAAASLLIEDSKMLPLSSSK